MCYRLHGQGVCVTSTLFLCIQHLYFVSTAILKRSTTRIWPPLLRGRRTCKLGGLRGEYTQKLGVFYSCLSSTTSNSYYLFVHEDLRWNKLPIILRESILWYSGHCPCCTGGTEDVSSQCFELLTLRLLVLHEKNWPQKVFVFKYSKRGGAPDFWDLYLSAFIASNKLSTYWCLNGQSKWNPLVGIKSFEASLYSRVIHCILRYYVLFWLNYNNCKMNHWSYIRLTRCTV